MDLFEEWKAFLEAPTVIKQEALEGKLRKNDSVSNEALAKDILSKQEHIVDFVYMLSSHDAVTFNTGLAILRTLSSLSSPFCRRLSAMCVPGLLLKEWLDGCEDAQKALQLIFTKQEHAIHPMPPTLRIPSIDSNPPKEITQLAQYYRGAFQMACDEENIIQLTKISRLTMTLRLSMYFIDFGTDCPPAVILLFNCFWISVLLEDDDHEKKSNDSLASEISQLLSSFNRQLIDDLLGLMDKKKDDVYSYINEDVIMMIFEWLVLSTPKTPISSKILFGLAGKRAKSKGMPRALLYLHSYQ